MARKPNYGIDAPGVIRNLFVACAVCLVLTKFVKGPGFFYSAASFALPGTLMLIYSLAGKFRHRERILAKVPWAGTEMVLDVGAGRGLLLIGAANISPPDTPPASSVAFVRLMAGFLSVFVASAFAERVQDLPKPTDYVNDNAHVLSSDAIARLDRLCGELDHSQANAQVAILTVRSLDGDDAADYANQVEDLWRIGKKGSDRGVLLLLAADEHKYRIDVGYGLEGILPDAKLGDIGRAMVPYLRTGEYDDAVKLAVGQVAQAISADAKISFDDAPVPRPRILSGQAIFITLVLLFGIGPIFLRIGYEIGRAIGLWKSPFPWAGSGSVEPSYRDDNSSSGTGSSSASSGRDFGGFGGGEFGGGGAGGSW
jgi:uncharacterized protein